MSLVGLPGSGKSTVGKALKEFHGWFFVDSDEEIEKKTSRKIVNIIREDGERAFRAIESGMINELICALVNRSEKFSAISLGGGALTSKEVCALVLKQTCVVYLDITHELQLERVFKEELESKGRGVRPLLLGSSVLSKDTVSEKLAVIRAERGKLFESANYKILTDCKSAEIIAREVVDLVTKGH